MFGSARYACIASAPNINFIVSGTDPVGTPHTPTFSIFYKKGVDKQGVVWYTVENIWKGRSLSYGTDAIPAHSVYKGGHFFILFLNGRRFARFSFAACQNNSKERKKA